MTITYQNPWIPSKALELLTAHTGKILDVGGSASPYAKANHIIDILPYSAERLQNNAWPACQHQKIWTSSNYSSLNIVEEKIWPFDTNQFDLGLSSHCLEDLRDPLPAVRELARVCRKVLIICPSRLIEQTSGIDHPMYCGFHHHPWMVYSKGNRLIFRRKTQLLALPEAHLTCPIGKTLKIDDGSMFFFGENVEPEEEVYWSEDEDLKDYARFIEPYRSRHDLFVDDGKRHTPLYMIRKFRQKFFGIL